jgi:hypothetical protein
LWVAEFSTRNLGIPTRILLVLYSKFRALGQLSCRFRALTGYHCYVTGSRYHLFTHCKTDVVNLLCCRALLFLVRCATWSTMATWFDTSYNTSLSHCYSERSTFIRYLCIMVEHAVSTTLYCNLLQRDVYTVKASLNWPALGPIKMDALERWPGLWDFNILRHFPQYL